MFAAQIRYLKLGAVATVLGLVTVGCGAAAEPTPTPTSPPTVAPATPTPPTTAAPATPTPTTSGVVVAVATPAPTATPTPLGVQPKYGGVVVFAHRRDPVRGFDLGGGITNQYVSVGIYGMGNLVRVCRPDPFIRCE